MATKEHLKQWVLDAVTALGGTARVVEVAQHLWNHHEDELRESGSLFYTWQYTMRWSALELRKENVLKPAGASPRGVWELV
jgi:hypothetical protein